MAMTRIVGTSKNTYNVTGYYEDQHFNARLAYNFRSAFYSGLDRSTAFTQDDTAYLSASLGYIDKRQYRADAGWAEPQQSDPEVLRARPNAAARVLHQRPAVLPESAHEVLIGAAPRPACVKLHRVPVFFTGHGRRMEW
jgi:hypothetical protein